MPEYPSMTRDDKKCQARWDAETLAEAENIKADSARFEAAQLAAAEKAKDKEEEAENLKKVATGKLSYPHMNTTEKGE
jgi:hypothetical protein